MHLLVGFFPALHGVLVCLNPVVQLYNCSLIGHCLLSPLLSSPMHDGKQYREARKHLAKFDRKLQIAYAFAIYHTTQQRKGETMTEETPGNQETPKDNTCDVCGGILRIAY